MSTDYIFQLMRFFACLSESEYKPKNEKYNRKAIQRQHKNMSVNHLCVSTNTDDNANFLRRKTDSLLAIVEIPLKHPYRTNGECL